MTGSDFGAEVFIRVMGVAAAYACLFAATEVLRCYARVSADVTRKVAHVGGGAIALTLPALFGSPWPVLALALTFVMVLLGTKRNGWLGSIHSVPRRTSGAYLFPIAVGAAFVLSQGDWTGYTVAVLALALGDAAAGLAGARWGRHGFAVWGERRTVEGSAGAFAATAVTTLAVLYVVRPQLGPVALLAVQVGLVVALVEAASPWGSDNLTVPLAALAALHADGAPMYMMLLEGATAATLALGVLAPRLAKRGSLPVSRSAPAPEAARVR